MACAYFYPNPRKYNKPNPSLSTTFLSIWRLKTIVETSAGWLPTPDPTWYGPISILLAVLEVHCASICASVPIFWPVVRPFFFKGEILVEHEIRIESSARYREDRATPSPSETDSQTELRDVESSTTNLQSRHYKDEYVMRQVNPLRDHLDTLAFVRGSSPRDMGRDWEKQ